MPTAVGRSALAPMKARSRGDAGAAAGALHATPETRLVGSQIVFCYLLRFAVRVRGKALVALIPSRPVPIATATALPQFKRGARGRAVSGGTAAANIAQVLGRTGQSPILGSILLGGGRGSAVALCALWPGADLKDTGTTLPSLEPASLRPRCDPFFGALQRLHSLRLFLRRAAIGLQ